MEFSTNRGEDLAELASRQKVMLVFLRHFGCTFCRETMSELAAKRYLIEGRNIKLVIVHMVSIEVAEEILSLYDLGGISHISDIHQTLYKRFGLNKASVRSLFGVPNWWRALVAGIIKGHLVGKPVGDPFQMPGVFIFHRNQILNKFTYRYVSDIPDFIKIAQAA